MNKEVYYLIAILVSFLVTFGLRSIPFIIFKGERKMPGWLDRLSKVLPTSLMAVLIIYCIKGSTIDPVHTGIPSLIACLVVGITYKWKHSMVLSIFTGTILYMILIRFI